VINARGSRHDVVMRWLLLLGLVASCNGGHAGTDGSVRRDADTSDASDAGDASVTDALPNECLGPVDPPQTPRPMGTYDGAAASGTRMKLQWMDFGGTRTAPEIYDSELAARCSAITWSDGNQYCTPETWHVFQYEDAQCTKPVTVGAPAGATFAHTSSVSAAAPCVLSAIDAVYRVGPPLANAQVYDRDPSGTCIGPFPTDEPVRQTVPMARSEFAPLAQAKGSATARLVERWITSSDGLRLPAGFYDQQLGASCSFEARDDQLAARCVPDAHRGAFGFLDGSCTTPATWDNPTACTDPWFAEERLDFSTRCGVEEPEMYAPACVAKPDHYYERSGSTCAAEPLGPTQIPYVLSPALDLAPSVRVRATGTRITHVQHETAGGVLEDPRLLFDHDLGTECVAQRDPTNGTIRCVPVGPHAPLNQLDGFSDPTCQTPVTVFHLTRGPGSCAAPNPGTYQRLGTSRFVRVEGEYTAPFYVDFGGCKLHPTAALAARYRVTEVPANVFATGTVVTGLFATRRQTVRNADNR
jgi:hypothetical protein